MIRQRLRTWWVKLVVFGFRLLYHEMAFTYDAVSWLVSMGEWRSWQRAALQHLNVPNGAQVLELAHGTGNLQIDLQTMGYKTAAIDFSPYMGRIARRKLRDHRMAVELARARAQALPFATNSFQAVVATFPTDYIVDPNTIREVYRVLQRGGRLVFVPSGALTRDGVLKRGIDAAYRATGQHTPSTSTASATESAWPAYVMERFAAQGFTISVVNVACRISIAQVIVASK